jgi:small subunit ribosomal protein S20
MANIKSKIKRIGTNNKARQRNLTVRTELKTRVRQTRQAIVLGELDQAQTNYKQAAKKLDIAVSKGVIHKNQAAKRKSKLANQINSLNASSDNNSKPDNNSEPKTNKTNNPPVKTRSKSTTSSKLSAVK